MDRTIVNVTIWRDSTNLENGSAPPPPAEKRGQTHQFIPGTGSTVRRRRSFRRRPRLGYGSARPVTRSYAHRVSRYALAKRAFDISVCLLASPVVVPLALMCALVVRGTSPGPILFRQKRTGQGGRVIEMLKFRSMVVDAEEKKALLKQNAGIQGPDFKLQNDPRITRAGAIMRKTSLDELPQLWNVLRGDMSLVGPRPTSFGVDTYQPWHAERLEVKPGLTGLWQIQARGDLDFDHRVRLDIKYVRHRNLPLDLWILARTVPCVLSRRGAF